MRLNGTLSAILGYFLWGILPIYWKQISFLPADEILAHRTVWSLVFVTSILVIRKNWHWISGFLSNRKAVLTFVLSSLIIGTNWYIYIWAVNHEYIVEASLGYFINPLFSVLLGVLFFKEKLNKLQYVAVGLALIGVIYLTINYGRLPWVAILLAFFFGLYGLVRKIGKLDASEGMFVEMVLLFFPALAYLLYLEITHRGAFGHADPLTSIYLVFAGAATMLPLLFFTYAAKRVPLSQLGLLQYLAPMLQFLIGVFIYKEEFTSSTLIGFIFIWTALIIYSWDLLRFSFSGKK